MSECRVCEMLKEGSFKMAEQLARADEIMAHMLPYIPGTIVTHDMGQCKYCGKPTASGMYIVCTDCLRREIRGFIRKGDGNAKDRDTVRGDDVDN